MPSLEQGDDADFLSFLSNSMPRKKYALSPGLWHILKFFTSQASKKQEGKEVRGKTISENTARFCSLAAPALQPEHTQGDPPGPRLLLQYLSPSSPGRLDIFESCLQTSLARHLLFLESILYWLSASPTGDCFSD